MGKNHLLRKLAIVLVAMILATTMVACGKSDKDDKETLASEETGSETKETQEETSKETEEDATEETSTEEEGDKLTINIASLKGPTSMGLVKVMEDSDNGQAMYDYEFSIVGTADEISPGIVSGDFDIAAVPANLASVLFNKSNGGVVVAGINTLLEFFYIVETGEQISSVEDLRGKTIYSTERTTPIYIKLSFNC